MKLHLPCRLRRAVVRALFAAATVVTTLASTTYADMITPDGRTATQVVQSGNVYDVYTNTVRGNTGFNSFSTFDVYADTTANLHLTDGTGRLINVVRDSASHIDGVLNSYRDGRIGGDVYFLNPHGIIVGKSGVVNVGSISMSTPTAAFVEQLIARDGSISATATQAVLAGDMPINEKGTISIKGKVNARSTAELRAGKVEVKGGEINTGVKFREMVNTGNRKVDTRGMSIRDGRLSFGKKPAKARRVAQDKERRAEKKTEIAIFANDVQVDGGDLNADWVYIDPDKLEFSNLAISGEYTLEARVIILNNISVKEGEKLTGFTLNAANELADGTFEGNVGITLSNSNITADRVDITASATANAAEAAITISASAIRTMLAENALNISATSKSGNTRVDIQGSTLTGAGDVEAAAVSLNGNATLTLGEASGITSDTVTLMAGTITGDATVNVQGRIAGGNTVNITASTGNVVGSDAEKIQDTEFTAEGGGDATVAVSGTVEAKGALTVAAIAQGTRGNATLNITGKLSSLYTETKAVGELGLERTQEETVQETDTQEQVNAKNAAYMKRYAEYLKGKPTGTAATATIELAANASAGNASITQAAASELRASLNTAINANAAKAASILLEGKTDSGSISASAKGETATLRVAETATLASHPHQSFTQDGTVISVSKNNGGIGLEARARREDSPTPAPEPEKKDGVLLEVAGTLTARREAQDGAGEGGNISLASDGKLTVTDTAGLDASSASGKGGTICFDAPEYELQSPLGYKVNGTTGSGTINLANHEGLTGENINNADTISSDFIKKVLNLSYANGDAPKEWTSDFTLVKLSGNIVLTKDVEASIKNAAIADGTHITGNGHSLTLTNSGWHRLSPTSVITIGKGVTIEGVRDFSFKFEKKSLADTLTGFYVFSPASLTVGENFKVNASGNVSITMEGFGNTYIEFGKGLDIQAGGDVTISAATQNGWGGCLGNTTPKDVVDAIVKMIPGAEDSETGKAFSKVGLVKFEASKFVIAVFKHLIGKKSSKEALPQIGVRVSKASVSFADSNAGSIRGRAVTISSSSSADLSGRQTAGSGGCAPLALSIGYIYNNSKVDLGRNLTITATGASSTTNSSVSITSTTKSKLSLENCFSSNTEDYALGLLMSVGTDFNAVNVDKSVTINAAKNITIGTASDISARPFMSLGSGWERIDEEMGKEYEPKAPAANNLFMLGVNLLVHKNQSTIDGTLTSAQGNIGIQSVDDIVSSLSMSGSLQYFQGKAEEKKPEKEQSFLEFLGTTFRECIVIDLGIGKMRIGENFKKLIDQDNLAEFFKKGQDLNEDLDLQDFTVDRSIAVSIATDIVVTNNNLQFNGTATAKNGSITLNAASSIEAACGAETSIVGVPSRQAVAGSISVPVLIGGTTVEIGSNAGINAGKDISVSSSTALPMSFDLLGWRDWAKFVTNAGGKRTPSQFLTALRGSLQYVRDYKDSGDFGILNSLTSSHASTLMKGTGTGEGDSKTIGGDLVVDVRNLDTKTVINDGAHLTAGGKLSAASSATGTQVTFAGQLPIYLTLCRPSYLSTLKADSGFGGSIIVGEKTLNTVTYIGAATLEARQLAVDATGDAFMMEMSVAGGFGSADDSVQGGVNVIIENKMTVSEISGGAKITLSGQGEKENSSITATDKGVLLNITGMEADGGATAVGVGVAVTVNNAFTAAMLGNNTPIGSSYESNWKSVWGDSTKPFDRAGAITLNFTGDSELSVEAVNKATLVNIGISAAVHTGNDKAKSVAASVGVDYSCTEATARQYGITGTGNNGRNNVATKAADTTTTVSVAGDVAVNVGGKDQVNGAGALSVNRGVMDTTAYVTDCTYSGVGEFTLDTSNKATAVAVDVAAGVGAADAGIAAGSAWNSLSGNTGSYLTGGSVGANKVSVTSLTDLTSFSCTLGVAVNISLGANGAGGEGIAQDIANILNDSFGDNNSERLENSFNSLDNLGGGNNANDSLLGGGLGIGEDIPVLMAANGDVSFDFGASVSRNAVGMSSKAIVEGCSVTTAGALEVTAKDTSVITAVSVGAAADKENGIAAGGVFSFAPVSSTTEAAIRQKKGAGSPLTISADSLKLHATDNHRERVWSFGGGYGDSAGIGMVLSWGSFAGATTLALIENVNATIGSSVDILASSDLDATFISVGGSASKKYAAVTGMVNYLNFNNTVLTDIKDSTLTVTAANGSIKALSQGTRTFADGVGDLAIRMSGKKGAAIGGALSFVYVGGNGTSDTNLTQMLVRGSTINNSGTTDLLATSSTTGTLAGVNAALAGGKGITFTGSFSWFSDSSFTQVDISDSTFNKRGGENDKNAKIKAEATGTSNLTLGLGSLSAQIGKGGGIGVGIGVLKDNSTTSATMQRSRVESARDFTLHASATSNLSGLVIGGAGSGLVGVSGGAFASTIAHNVIAEMKESIMNMNGALTIKADNHSNVGKDKGTRFTLANGALGGLGGGVGVAVSCINVEDQVVAKAHNVSVNSGSMDVLAEEYSDADAVTVNMAGGLYVGMDVDVVRPVLRGAARASITSDLLTIADNTPVGITTTGNLNVQASNTQWMRSHLWAFALSVNPEASLAANICVNDMTMAGSSNALIQGNMPLDIGGDMNVLADTVRTATYTTVPVSGSLGLSLNIDVNSLRVSSDTSSLTNAEKEKKTEAAAQIDKEIDAVCNLLQSADIKLAKDTSLTVSGDVRGAMSNAAAALAKIETPETTAKVDLGGNTATVGGNVDIKATDTITTTPTTVPVTGGILAIAPHFGKTKVESTVEAIVKDSTINAAGNISVDARQTHRDDFHNVGVAVAGGSVTTAVYDWTDKATTATSLQGNTKLKSTGGSVTIGTDTDILETFHHVNVGVAIGKIAFILPTFRQTESNTLTIGNGVNIEAKGAVTIGTNSKSKLDASTYDITLAAINAGLNSSEIIMSTTPELTIGDNAAITGASVGIRQDINREIGIVENHISATGLSLSFPFLTITDTVDATLSVGNGSTVTATTGDLNIASHVNTHAKLAFLGVNAIGISASGAQNKFTEKVTNKAKLGKNVKLRAQNGTMTVHADNKHTGEMSGYNITANALNIMDELTTYNHGEFTADVTIGTGFDAAGRALTLEVLNAEEYLCHGKKVTVSLAVNPYSKNAIDVKDTSTATITLEGGRIDVSQFYAKALTDVAVKVNQMLGGGSITVDVNIGKVKSEITQTSSITLGTGSNELDILTDNTEITAHNKHYFDRLDPTTDSIIFGGDIGLVSGTSKGTIDAKQTLNATVTLGSGSKIRRRADAEHYLKKDEYKALVSATNNVDSRALINLFSGGILNANCVLTTWNATTANATLNLNGSIDTWGDTEFTAYSHAIHAMNNSLASGAIIPTFNSDVKNTIDTDDRVNINGAVESIGNITIQSGSAGRRYKLVDGTTVIPGDDDTNTTVYSWGKEDAVIHNNRSGSITINKDVRAGGELAIYNDSSANTVKKPFKQTKESEDYRNAATDTAAAVTSSITLGADARLYAGLGSAVKVSFSPGGGTPVMEFTSAQRIFDGSSGRNGVWTASSETLKELFTYTAGSSGSKGLLSLKPLTVPGMAFRVETKAAGSVFNGKLYSLAEHGLDIYFPLGLSADVETQGASLRGHETGLFFNRQAVVNAVSSCDGPDLYLNEGVAIRSNATGNLTLSGRYAFPYSLLHASSLYDLIISGEVRCGTTTMQAGGNFRFDNPNKDYPLQGPLDMYTGLFNVWEAEAQAKLVDHAKTVAANSGDNGNKTTSSTESWFDDATYTKEYSYNEVRNRVDSKPSSLEAMGTVSITARIVDINGEIYSGPRGDAAIIIPKVFQVLDAKGNPITLDNARAIYERDKTKSVFKLDGYSGVTLMYDFSTNQITLNDIVARDSGIEITGVIVNTDPTGRGGLHVMGSKSTVEIDNRSPYLLNIGNVDLSSMSCHGITLRNTATGKTTTYTEDSVLSQYEPADYCLRMTRQTKTQLTESGRLTFGGSEGEDKDTARRGVFGDKVAGYVGDKDGGRKTIIDRIDVNTATVTTTQALDYEYVARPDSMPSGDQAFAKATSTQNTPTSRTFTYVKKDAMHRDMYVDMKYDVTTTNELLIRANNKINIDFGGSTGDYSRFTVTSGDVNFLGKVSADICTVNAGNSITALSTALVNAGTLNMTARRGSIGTEQQAFTFNAGREVNATAGQYIFLTTYKDTAKANLNAGMNLNLQSFATVNGLEYSAGGMATVSAAGSITVTNGYAGRTTLLSQTGSITANYGAGAKTGPGILTAEAEQDICISSEGELTLYYVESRRAGVNLHAEKGITSARSVNMSGFAAEPGSKSLSLKSQAEATMNNLADEYYAKLLHYEQLYYEKDKDGNYTHRAADGTTFVLPDEADARKELRTTFHDLYYNGKAVHLGGLVYSLSGTEAVGKTEFAGETEALRYLADNPGKLESLADAYYNKLIEGLTTDIRNLHGTRETVKYGQFNEVLYRMYWQKDKTGTTYINQVQSGDNKGLFISPRRYDAAGNDIGPVYSDEMCAAITAQFKGQNPHSSYKSKRSEVLQTLANATSGYLAASSLLNQVNAKVATTFGEQSADLIETTVRAATGITLTTNTDPDPKKGGFIGSNVFYFTISPIGKDQDGKYIYSDWATAFLAEQGTTKAGSRILDATSGEYTIALDYVDVTKGSFSELDMFFLQQAAPQDIEKYPGGVTRVLVSTYIGVEAPVINASGNTVRLACQGGFDLGKGNITAQNLYLSTQGSITGTLESDGGTITLFASAGIGSADNYFGIKGSSTYTIGSAGDIYLKANGDVKVDSLYGQHVSVDTREGRLLPVGTDKKKANIIGRRIDWYGNLNTGLGFQTSGATQENGGLHWHGGSSSDLKYSALNTAYPFWFVVENDTNALSGSGNVEIDYCGRLVLVGLTRTESAAFHQIDAGSGQNVLEFTEAGYFNGTLTFSGESSYTVLAPELLTLNSAPDISVGGDADLRLAGIDSAENKTIQINSTGNLTLSFYDPAALCNICDALAIDGTGNVTLNGVVVNGEADINAAGNIIAGAVAFDTFANLVGNSIFLAAATGGDELLLNGRNGITGLGVVCPNITADSSNAGVFLQANTNDLSGTSRKSFAAALETMPGSDSITVHDVEAAGSSARIKIRAITDELLLDGLISAAALEFYGSGDITRSSDVRLLSDYSFMDVWKDNYAAVWDVVISSLEADLRESLVWLFETSDTYADKSTDDARKMRDNANGRDDSPTVPPLHFTDKDGNAVSREQYANLITNK